MKKCPYCAEQIQDEAILCRYCGKYINDGLSNNPKVVFIDKDEDILFDAFGKSFFSSPKGAIYIIQNEFTDFSKLFSSILQRFLNSNKIEMDQITNNLKYFSLRITKIGFILISIGAIKGGNFVNDNNIALIRDRVTGDFLNYIKNWINRAKDERLLDDVLSGGSIDDWYIEIKNDISTCAKKLTDYGYENRGELKLINTEKGITTFESNIHKYFL